MSHGASGDVPRSAILPDPAPLPAHRDAAFLQEIVNSHIDRTAFIMLSFILERTKKGPR